MFCIIYFHAHSLQPFDLCFVGPFLKALGANLLEHELCAKFMTDTTILKLKKICYLHAVKDLRVLEESICWKGSKTEKRLCKG
jgi:hypothetical protein